MARPVAPSAKCALLFPDTPRRVALGARCGCSKWAVSPFLYSTLPSHFAFFLLTVICDRRQIMSTKVLESKKKAASVVPEMRVSGQQDGRHGLCEARKPQAETSQGDPIGSRFQKSALSVARTLAGFSFWHKCAAHLAAATRSNARQSIMLRRALKAAKCDAPSGASSSSRPGSCPGTSLPSWHDGADAGGRGSFLLHLQECSPPGPPGATCWRCGP